MAALIPGVPEVTAQDVRDACVSSKTQRAYNGSLRVISRWIKATKPDNTDQYFDSNGQIILDHFTPSDFDDFLLEKRKSVSVGMLSGYRSAIKDLYRKKERSLPLAYNSKLTRLFSGLKRTEVSKFQSGSPKESGKAPLPFSLYRDLCRATLARQDAGFANLFLTTQWNLMCRSESVQTLCTEHLSNHDDSVGIMMYKSKTNQEGNAPKDPRHM
ncbi:hypothetical protein L915_12394 [Phytophthora nicotianae]|uniref:Core-binding (CB) domain-containing protein n=1 Tax=Phytophthora nicotianae TaxID=4792 RepID=W2GIX7_PHYNI|nr:hypothetical protein L915_12394 [Phytophthora nicotianae]